MPEDDDALGAGSLAVWTRRAALSRLTPAQIATAVRHGEWQSPWRGVFADSGFVLDPLQRGLAAVLASGGEGQPVPVAGPDPSTGTQRGQLRAVAVGRTAARCWGFPLVDDDDPATGRCERLVDEVAVWHHGRRLERVDGEGQVHQLRRHRLRFGPQDVVRHACGLYLSSPLRTVLDCALLLPLDAAVCVADDALHRALVDRGALEAAVAARRGHPHAQRVSDVVRLADGRSESPGETLARLLLRPVLPGLVPQVRLWDGDRVLARFDLADEDLRLAVEHDGRRGHEGRAADDQRRDAVTSRRGWSTERVTWYQVRRQPDRTRARVVARADELRTARRLTTGTSTS